MGFQGVYTNMKAEGREGDPPFLSFIGPILFLVGIFFLNFLSRIIFSPLMPAIQKDLNVGHDEAGSFFLFIAAGYSMMMLFSGFISSHLNHRRTIILSATALGGALVVVALSHHLWIIRLGVFLMGIAAGFYLPSGLSTLTALVKPKDWGKAIGIHELAPNLSFLIAPFLAEFLLGWFSWRGVIATLGVSSVGAAAIYAFWGKGGDFPGESPDSRTLRSILVMPSFWIMVSLFTLAMGGQVGVYSILPLYLVSDIGMDRTLANSYLGFSRMLTLLMPLLSGWITDRLGLKKTLQAVFLCTGVMTILLGVAHGSLLILAIFLQPMMMTCFFPAGFLALSRIGSPSMKNVAISLTAPICTLLGGGAVPAGIGFIGEKGFFSLGITVYGGILILGSILVRYLKLADK